MKVCFASAWGVARACAAGTSPRGVLAGSALLLSALPALAASVTSTKAAAHLTGPQVAAADQKNEAASGEFSSSAAVSGNGGGGTGDASAQIGVLKVFASMFSDAGGKLGGGSAQASYAEDITISSAGLNGTTGRITVGVTLQGMIDPQGSGGGSVDFSFGAGAMGGFLGSWSAQSSPSFPGGFPVDGVSASAGGPLFYSNIHETTFDFTVGSAFTVVERLSVSTSKIDCPFNVAQCNASSAGSVNIDFGHSSYWNGVSAISLFDAATGKYVPADLSLFSATSSQGLDMMNSFAPPPAVPEPTNALLMFIGLLGIGATTRRAMASTERSTPNSSLGDRGSVKAAPSGTLSRRARTTACCG